MRWQEATRSFATKTPFEFRAILSMTGPIQPDQLQSDATWRNVFETLIHKDDNPVWRSYVRFVCNCNLADAAAVSQWSDRTVTAVTNALHSVQTMRTSADEFSEASNAVADSFSELADEFFDHIVSGKQSETLLVVSYGRRRVESHAFFVKRFNALYFSGSTDEPYMAGPYLSLDECLAHARSFMVDRCKNRLVSVSFSPPVPIRFVEEIIVSVFPLIGTRFTVNGKLCARSVGTAFVDLSG